MKKIITILSVVIFLIGIIPSLVAQTPDERMQFYKEYKIAIDKKIAYINSDPALKQEAISSGWFEKIAIGLKNAEDFANGIGYNPMLPMGGTCATAMPFCASEGMTYPAGTNTGSGEAGPCYSCLGSQPNPAWFYMKVLVGGDIHITETNSNNVDVDFCLWGPFPSQNSCGDLSCAKVIDCSFSSVATEYIDIPTSVAGDYYLLIITNFSNSPTNISMIQTSGSGLTDCGIVAPPAPVAGAASGVTPTGFVANWGASAGAAGYYLDVSLNAAFTSFVPGYNNLNVGNIYSTAVSPLLPGTTYFYRLRAYQGAATSSNSNIITVTTPATITGSNNLCANSANNTYVTQSGMSGYVWNITGGNITGGAGTNQVIVTWTTTGTGTLNVNFTTVAGFPTNGALSVTVNPQPTPTIGGSATACVNTTGNTYTTQSGNSGYVWTISAGGSIASGQGTNTISVNWNTVGAQTVSVNYANSSGCWASTPTVFNVTVYPRPVPTITGPPDGFCPSWEWRQYQTESGNNSYIWNISSGGAIAEGQGTSAVEIYWFSGGSQWLSVIYNSPQGCTAVVSTVLDVNILFPPGSPVPIQGSTEVCVGTENESYYVEPIAYATDYDWGLPDGATIVSGAGTNSITVNFGSNAISGELSVSGNNDCGPGGVSHILVNVNPLPETPVVTDDGNLLTSSAPIGNQWYRNGSLIEGANEQTYLVPFNKPGWYWTIVTLENGCTSDTSNHVYVAGVGIPENKIPEFRISPVPNDGLFMVTINSETMEIFNLKVYNTLGEVVYEVPELTVNGKYEQKIDMRNSRPGIYTLFLMNTQKQLFKKIIISR